MRKFWLGFFCLISLTVNGQKSPDGKSSAFIQTVEQSLNLFYDEYANSTNYDSIMRVFNYDANQVPVFTDEVYCQRIKEIAKLTPMPFQCNDASLSVVKFFAKNRINFIRVVMGRSALYFDLFEEKLAEYELPLELKYLAVIESGLRPQVRSRAGALGLWQFMYRTGLYFGLTENSYIDERMDPEKATIAACKYLKQLHGIYGDWFLALAAYNAGPGNVNKAIRRSGGKKTYWEIRPFLPNETQGYVPNFIAATYMCKYHKEHNIIPIPAKIHYAQLDTMCLKQQVDMNTIYDLTGWEVEDIKVLNPVYKTKIIPETTPPQCITGPLQTIGMLVSKEQDLYKKVEVIELPVEAVKTENLSGYINLDEPITTTAVETFVTHVVKEGETLELISKAYKVKEEDVIIWNNLALPDLYIGQKLKVAGTKVLTIPTVPAPQVAPAKKYYTVRRGDTFSNIAARYGMTQSQLSKLNPNIRISRLDVGQRLRVK